MKLQITDTYENMSAAAAAVVAEQIKRKPGSLLCFATGDTPKLTYRLLVQKIREENIDISQCFFIGLDEWLGIPPDNEGSCDFFLNEYLFSPLKLKPKQIHLFDGLTNDEEGECKMMNDLIKDKGGIDLAVVGVGMNGHIGFNEPGTPVDAVAHVSQLHETTTSVGKKYFTEVQQLHTGLTVGLKQLMEARQLLMIANGEKKAPVIKRATEEEITIDFPASLMRQHPNGIIIIDNAAASALQTKIG